MAVIVVTDGEQRASLAIVRSLGSAGHRVVVASRDGRSLAGASRYAARDVAAPSALATPDAFMSAMLKVVRDACADVVIPVTEASLLGLLARSEAFAPAVLPFPPLAAFRRASDKAWAATAAGRVGLAVPAGILLRTREEAASLPRSTSGARVLKPARSVQGGTTLGVSYVAAGGDAQAAVEALPAAAFPVLVQERIEGPGVGVFLLRWSGRTHAFFAHRRLREKPPSGGVSVLRESTGLDPDLRARCEALLDLLEWRGVAMLEMKISAADGRPYFMEINGRFWGSLQLAIDAGVDFPWRLVELALGTDPGPAPDYRVGVRSRWTMGDLDHLLVRLRRGGAALDLPSDAAGRGATLARFLRDFLPPVRGEVFRLSDPHPATREAWAWLRDLKG